MNSSLWEEAAKTVHPNWQPQLEALKSLSCGPNELLDAVTKGRDNCRSKRWRCYKVDGQKVYIRDILEKAVFWLEKIKDVGDVIVQFDPVHASLPWAGARFLLTAATSDINKYSAMLESMEIVISAVSRYAMLEQIYCNNSPSNTLNSDTQVMMQKNVVAVYTSILVFLCKAKKYFEQSSAHAVVEKIKSVADGERISATSEGVRFIRKDMEDLHYSMQHLMDTLSHLERPTDRINYQLQQVQDGLNREERRKIMRWLSNEQFKAHHRVIARNRLEGSGSWLYDKAEYMKWRKSSQCSLLWLHGDPGAGKSVLVSLVIDNLSKELEEVPHSPPLAFFYCTRESSEPRRADPTEILLSILRQLSCSNDQDAIKMPVTTMWQERQAEGSDHRPDLSECVDMIIEVTRETSAIIVMDALDECQVATRHELLEALDRIIQESERIIKIFVSSRRDADIRQHFQRIPKLEIAASDNMEDITNYINSEIGKKIQTRKLLGGNPSPELVSDIKETLLKGAEGIFRWVSASIQTLCSPTMQFEADIRLALGRLPPDLKGVYAIILDQVHNGGPWGGPLAKKALRWLLCGRQPLSSTEFMKALTIDLDSSISAISVENLLDICCNLVKYDGELDVFRFIHLSVREYLEQQESEYGRSLSHSTIAQACLQSCLIGRKPKRRKRTPWSQNNTFYDYSNVYWPLHCQDSGHYRLQGKLRELVNEVFTCPRGKPTKSFQTWLGSWRESWGEMDLGNRDTEANLYGKLNQCSYWPSSVDGTACAFGFVEVVRNRLNYSLRDKRFYEERALEFAVRYGHQEVVELLVSDPTSELSTSVNEQALEAAVYMSRKEITLFLFKQNPFLSVTINVLRSAASNGDLKTMLFLLEKVDHLGVDSEILRNAAGNETAGDRIVDLLLERDLAAPITADVIQYACMNRNHGFKIVGSLLQRGGDVRIPVEAAEFAAHDDRCGLAILQLISASTTGLLITPELIESAARNSTLDPMRLLLAKDGSVSISYESLAIAVRNSEIGDRLTPLLLSNCSAELIDEDLILSAMSNRRHDLEVTKSILSKAGTSIITPEVLYAAARNQYHGQSLLEEFFRCSPEIKLSASIGVAAILNRYSPREVLDLVLQQDENLHLTQEILVSAMFNGDHALDLLQFILERDNSLTITPEAVEIVARNEQSGLEVIQYMYEHLHLPVSTGGLVAAAQNKAFGDAIMSIMLTNYAVAVDSRIVVSALNNESLGPEILSLLLKRNLVSTFSEDEMEIAVSNTRCGARLVEIILHSKVTFSITDSVVSTAGRNFEMGADILRLLFSDSITPPVTNKVVECVLASSWISSEAIEVLLTVSMPSAITTEAVDNAMDIADDALAIIKLLLARNPNIQFPSSSVEKFENENLLKLLKYLETQGTYVPISESILRRILNLHSSQFSDLQSFVEQCTVRNTVLPISVETLESALKRSDPGAILVVRLLLRLFNDQGQTIEVTEMLIKASICSANGPAMLEILSELHGRPLPLTLSILKEAVANDAAGTPVLEILLKDRTDDIRCLLNDESVLAAVVLNHRNMRLILRYITTVVPGKKLAITSKVLAAAAKAGPGPWVTFLRILHRQGQDHLVSGLITEEVLVKAARYWPSLKAIVKTLKQHGQHFTVTPKLMLEAADKGNLNAMCILLEQQCQTDLIPMLITEKVLVKALRVSLRFGTLKCLKLYLNEEQIASLVTETVLCAAGRTPELEDWMGYMRPAPAHEKEYYYNIFKLETAVQQNHTIKISSLLERGTLPSIPGRHGRINIARAAECQCIPSVRELLKYSNVEKDHQCSEGRTALMWAARGDCASIVDMLLDAGADTSLVDNKGKTAEQLAMDNGHYMIARKIGGYGAERCTAKEEVVVEDIPTQKMENLLLRKSGTF